METSQSGIDMIKESEGFKGRIYRDKAGHETIGYGHKLTKKEKDTGKYKGGISKKDAEDLLRQDLEQAENAVNKDVKVPLNQNQFDALVSFVFNVGAGKFNRSTLLKRLNNGEYDAVPAELARWNKAGGEVTPGLVTRRQKEAELWSEPVQEETKAKDEEKEEQPSEPPRPPGGGGGAGPEPVGISLPSCCCCCPHKITITLEFTPGTCTPTAVAKVTHGALKVSPLSGKKT